MHTSMCMHACVCVHVQDILLFHFCVLACVFVCAFIYACVPVCACACVCAHVYICVCACLCLCMCMYVCVLACMCACIGVHDNLALPLVCTCLCVCKCVCACMYVYTIYTPYPSLHVPDPPCVCVGVCPHDGLPRSQSLNKETNHTKMKLTVERK